MEVSQLIKLYPDYEKQYIEQRSFSHVGMVVKSDLLSKCSIAGKEYKLDPDKIYIWESVLSGKLSDHVNDISNKPYLGVQLRCFDDIMAGYEEGKTEIAIGRLAESIKINQTAINAFAEIFKELNGIPFEHDLVSILSCIFHDLVEFRNLIETETKSKNWLFCSELVALVMKKMGVFGQQIDQRNIAPMDFVPGFYKSELNSFYNTLVYIKK
jgi:hypothetical protein